MEKLEAACERHAQEMLHRARGARHIEAKRRAQAPAGCTPSDARGGARPEPFASLFKPGPDHGCAALRAQSSSPELSIQPLHALGTAVGNMRAGSCCIAVLLLGAALFLGAADAVKPYRIVQG